METSQAGNASPSEEVGTPWLDKWNDVKATVEKAVVEPIKQAAKAPWEMVWGVDKKAPPKAPEQAPDQFETVFNRLITQESGGKHTNASGEMITSPKGAQGITQVMRDTGDDPGFGVAPLKNKSQAEYLRFGREYLKAMLNEFDGDYDKALAAYNAGVGNVKSAVAKGGAKWKDHLPKRDETIPYIDRILGKT